MSNFKIIKKEVIKENEPYYDEGNYLCLVQISDSEINKKNDLCRKQIKRTK